MPATNRRARAVFVGLTLLFSGIVFRLYDLQISGHEEYRRARDGQSRGIVDQRRPRGTIFDARGDALAISVPVSSVGAEPARMTDLPGAARRLAPALGMEAAAVLKLLDRTRTGPDGAPRRYDFVWLRRHVTQATAEAVSALNVPGIILKEELDRSYPRGSLLAHVLGLVKIEDRGREGSAGLEQGCDAWLAGERSLEPVAVDGRRRKLTWPAAGSGGGDVHLTIDAQFQRVVEDALDAACERHRPAWAVAVAIDPRTGAILALANRPAYDPNRPGPNAGFRNLAVFEQYEPGSTWKVFTVAGALDAGAVAPSMVFDCEMGSWKYGARVLHDHDPFGRLSVTDIIVHSSNIGAAKVGIRLGPKRLRETAEAFGFGRRTGVDLPSESRGILHPLERWNSFSITSVPMGHEISATPIQLVAAFAAIANGGSLMRPYVVDRLVGADGGLHRRAEPKVVGRAASEKSAGELRRMLREAVKSGTGTKADVEGLEVAGKTGTTQKVDPATGRYTKGRYTSSFVGFAPAEGARVCVAVIIDEPKGDYYGGAVAAPVVAEILKNGFKFVR
jgi:cell division protein FtsI (penicillin-binding protein 3)